MRPSDTDSRLLTLPTFNGFSTIYFTSHKKGSFHHQKEPDFRPLALHYHNEKKNELKKKERLLLWLGMNLSRWRKVRAMDSYGASRSKKIESDDEFLCSPKVGFHDFIYIESTYQNSLYSHDSIRVHWLMIDFSFFGSDWNTGEIGRLWRFIMGYL